MTNYYAVTYSNYLSHHGIKGQKWGIRRFRNEDGTLTAEGKRRYGTDSNDRGTSSKIKTAAKIGAAVLTTAAVTAYVAKHPEAVQKASKYVYEHKDETINAIKKAGTAAARITKKGAKAAGKVIGNVGVKAGKAAMKSLEKAGDAALNAAMATAGSMAALKIAEKYSARDDDPERVKFAKKIAVESAKAAIKAATNANNSNSNKGGSVGKDVTAAIGGPSNKGIDRSSARYQALFKDSSGNQRDSDTRSTIKSMASAGYDLDQIERYLAMKHSMNSKNNYYAIVYSNSLSHHGIKGQKWGVRRYRNYDGSLTRRGLERYNKTEKNYEYSKNKYKNIKNKYKHGEATSLDVKNAKYIMNEDKRTMNKYYKQLHKDYMADKGKELYREGKRIRTRGRVFANIASGSAAAAAVLKYMGNDNLAKKAGYLSMGAGAAYAVINAYAELPMGDNARLRAYYSHKSLPDVKVKGEK